jgi:hypothetical protein
MTPKQRDVRFFDLKRAFGGIAVIASIHAY